MWKGRILLIRRYRLKTFVKKIGAKGTELVQPIGSISLGKLTADIVETTRNGKIRETVKEFLA